MDNSRQIKNTELEQVTGGTTTEELIEREKERILKEMEMEMLKDSLIDEHLPKHPTLDGGFDSPTIPEPEKKFPTP